ncbi:MAG: exodeoxyribonuclease V subunit gamma, partial [Kangiellaceae bacterium]|nr:exodeoxyribonuclease V subunit gamma [Kangiellaceae bacterium]
MLHLNTSNQLEQLATQYARVTNEPLSKVFEPECLVIQNAGMARYLSMHVADLSGISANTEALFPAEFMWKLLRIVSPDVSKQSECSPDALRFHIMQELTDNPSDYPEIQHYIFDDNESATWDLSGQVSQLLDQYLFYRSDWVREWEAGEFDPSNWQARLWNRCVKDKNLTHWITLQDQFKNAFNSIEASHFPTRVSFFSMSALSPGYLDLLGELAKKTDVHLFIINPCEDVYWGDIASEKTRAKLPLEKQAYIDVGNPLLASMGTQGRDFIEQLLSTPELEHQVITSDEIPVNSLLQKLQSDIFNLQAPEKSKDKEPPRYPKDNSITFNACHTAMREVEVLHDQILNALDNDATLAPADIVVMMPDIEKYAPYIEAVFSTPITSHFGSTQRAAAQQKLPFSIADRNPLSASNMIEALNKILQLSDTRFDVESVFELLDYDEIRAQFNLDENQVIQCRRQAKSTNIRWGINANYRKQNNLPTTDEHTWKYALDRMLLGYALGDTPDATEQLFESHADMKTDLPLLAYNDIEGSNAVMLADLKRFTDTIFRVHQWNHQSHSVIDWLDKAKDLLSQLFTDDSDTQALLKSFDNIRNNALLTDFKQELSFVIFQKLLIENLQKITGTEKYLGHGITFCALVPMRSVPFKLVALMGMNDGEYPRQDKRHSFDLTASQPRRGDRSRRDEDRYLFLESILATRSRLMISFTGQSVHDNSTLPPSVLVNELLDTLATYTGEKPESFICKHPLQAFSPRYFQDNSTLFSYANEYLKLHTDKFFDDKTKAPSGIFISERLAELDDSYKHVTLDELIKFYQNPAKSFLQLRFSIQTFDDDISLPIREPFELESFKDREIREMIMPCDESTQDAQLIARAKGLLPYGEIGDAVFNNEKQTIETFKAQLPELKLQDSRTFSLKLGDFQLSGKLDKLTNSGRVVQQVTSPYFRDYISLWLTHLALNTQDETPTSFYSPDL